MKERSDNKVEKKTRIGLEPPSWEEREKKKEKHLNSSGTETPTEETKIQDLRRGHRTVQERPGPVFCVRKEQAGKQKLPSTLPTCNPTPSHHTRHKAEKEKKLGPRDPEGSRESGE